MLFLPGVQFEQGLEVPLLPSGIPVTFTEAAFCGTVSCCHLARVYSSPLTGQPLNGQPFHRFIAVKRLNRHDDDAGGTEMAKTPAVLGVKRKKIAFNSV